MVLLCLSSVCFQDFLSSPHANLSVLPSLHHDIGNLPLSANMPYLHCLATKCTIPPSDRFPWFFSSALPIRSSSISSRSLSSTPFHKSVLTKRQYYYTGSNSLAGWQIACIIIAMISIISGILRLIWLRKQRSALKAHIQLGMNEDYWIPAPKPLPAHAYEMDSRTLIPDHPETPAPVYCKTRREDQWDSVDLSSGKMR